MIEITCKKCGKTVSDAAKLGHYLERTSPKGQAFEGHCAPYCEPLSGDEDDAVISAICGYV